MSCRFKYTSDGRYCRKHNRYDTEYSTNDTQGNRYHFDTDMKVRGVTCSLSLFNTVISQITHHSLKINPNCTPFYFSMSTA